MAKVPGFLRPKEKIDEAELERVRIRTLERLAEMFGVTAASDPAPAELPAATGQPRAAEAPPDLRPAAPPGRRGATRPPNPVERPPDLVGVMATPERPDDEARSEPEAATLVGVMAGHGPADKVALSDDWRSRADAYVLAVAFGTASRPMPGRGADSAVRVETRTADANQPVPAGDSVDLRREGPMAVEQASGRVLRKLGGNGPRPASGSRS